jgi:beta-aspartyl-peptidase (threonine type)
MNDFAVVCHGGAGHLAQDQPGVDRAVEAASLILKNGGAAIEAAIAAVMIMEDDPVLNAGTGGRIREDGSVQLDAAIMCSDGRFGAVVCIEETQNPILVAEKLLDDNINMLAGRGAREFADRQNIPREKVIGSKKATANDTVGAIVRDANNLIVVASSTGGCTGRPSGRVGDTPLIGAGLWCDENIGIAATGIGEAITLKMPCIRIADTRAKYASLVDALDWGVALFDPSIEVGLIGLERTGSGLGRANTSMPWAEWHS